ncbi:hypothetical protein AB0F68_12920 [Micromonospora sp. NPDC023966]|uniref:hypothetical protein n=1 Tax=Micromonospora sp. NPDC023966 TaxID=3154699 RepID=UPI003402C598
MWAEPYAQALAAVAPNVSERGFRDEFLGELPDAELHLLDGGHWLLETHLGDVVAPMRDFLARVHR